jgi:hypothetical protein
MSFPVNRFGEIEAILIVGFKNNVVTLSGNKEKRK